MVAAEKGNERLVDVLIKAGADVNLEQEDDEEYVYEGLTPLDPPIRIITNCFIFPKRCCEYKPLIRKTNAY